MCRGSTPDIWSSTFSICLTTLLRASVLLALLRTTNKNTLLFPYPQAKATISSAASAQKAAAVAEVQSKEAVAAAEQQCAQMQKQLVTLNHQVSAAQRRTDEAQAVRQAIVGELEEFSASAVEMIEEL